MRYRPRRLKRLQRASAALAIAAAAATVHADITLLNQFANTGLGALNPYGVSVSSTGEVVVVDFFDATGAAYNPDGTYSFSLVGDSGYSSHSNFTLGHPEFAAIGPDGSIYLNTSNAGDVQAYTPTGLSNYFVATGLSSNVGLAVNSSNTLFTAQRAADVIDLYTTSGTPLGSFGSSGSGPGQMSGPEGIALDSTQSNLYVADSGNNRIDVFSSGGSPEFSFDPTSGPGQLSNPQAVAVSATGLVYVTDANNGIKIFSASGSYLETVAATVQGQSFLPTGVAVSPAGMVYAVGFPGGSVNAAAYRFFDPASWASGTNTFTNSATGPTSIAAGAGQLLGTSLTLNPTMNLVVGNTTSVIDGGTLNLAGGTLNTPTLVVDGTTGGANFTMSSGTLTTGVVSVIGGGVADFAGAGISAAIAGSVSVSGAGSQFKVDQGAVFSATGLTNTGGQVTLGTNADFIVYASTINNGAINLAGGELDVRGTLTNAATIQGNGILSTTAGLTNNANLSLAGASEVLGPVTNTGTIQISGIQPTVFFSTVTNSGKIIVDTGASATFDGGITGNSPINSLTIGDGSSVALNSPANTISQLDIAGTLGHWTGQLDLKNNVLFIDYGNAPDPIATIISYLVSGYDNGAWNGNGIISTAAQSNSGSYGIGYADSADPGNPAQLPSGTIEIMFTLLGDANLDGKVNGSDFNILAANFNTGGDTWDQGDFNYDGKVNGSDFNDLAANFNQAATQSAASAADFAALNSFAAANGIILATVPEPATAAMLVIVASGFLARRRRARI